jgi:L-seryl-tRNA(Ser) seleniumtransferase
MSGDKLLGGPQAGIIVGAATHIAAMRTNPLARSYRVDKMTLAALEATLALYREPEVARREIPTLAMLSATIAELRARGTECMRLLHAAGIACDLVESESSVGAGAFPTATLPSVALALAGDAERWAAALRAGELPVIGRVHEGRVLLDFRTVPAVSVAALADAVVAAHG